MLLPISVYQTYVIGSSVPYLRLMICRLKELCNGSNRRSVLEPLLTLDNHLLHREQHAVVVLIIFIYPWVALLWDLDIVDLYCINSTHISLMQDSIVLVLLILLLSRVALQGSLSY